MHRDLGFLLSIKPTFISRRTAKYLLEEGVDEVIGSFKEDAFEAYYSCLKYDYDGRNVEKIAVGKLASDKPEPLHAEIMSMRVKEKAWFNVCDQLVHVPSDKTELLEDGSIVEDAEEELERNHAARTGFHYEITLDHIEFRNSEKIEIKRKINEEYREKGRKLFQEKKFFEATKAYRYLINISENFPRNNPYLPEERAELESININAKLNYVRCYFRIEEEWNKKDLADFAKEVLDFLLRKRPEDHTTHFFHAKWLLRERVLDSALEAARRSNALKRNAATDELIAEILCEKKNKGKLKVAVSA